MILISHRGNLEGKNPSRENNPDYIDEAIFNGYDVEVDVWFENRNWFLGHDEGQYPVTTEWIQKRERYLWIHAKNLSALSALSLTDLHYFWHQEDLATITSKGYLWIYPGHQPILNSISVLPELKNEDFSKSKGICSDFISNYKK